MLHQSNIQSYRVKLLNDINNRNKRCGKSVESFIADECRLLYFVWHQCTFRDLFGAFDGGGDRSAYHIRHFVILRYLVVRLVLQ